MKKLLPLLTILIAIASCSKNPVNTPQKLIDQDEMVNIIYDVAILDAMRSRNPMAPENASGRNFIYKKYGIDSLQFAQNNAYYASDIKAYKKIYEKVAERVETEKNHFDSLVKKQGIKPAEQNPVEPVKPFGKPQVQ